MKYLLTSLLLVTILGVHGQNVGIGTTAPATTLHVVDGSNPAIIRVQNASAFGDAAIEMQSSPTTYDFLELRKWKTGASGTIAGIPLSGLSQLTTGAAAGSGLLIGTKLAQPLYFTTNNLQRIQVGADGRIAINTTGITSPFEYQVQVNAGNRGGAIFLENPVSGAHETVSIGRGVDASRFVRTTALHVIASGDRAIVAEGDAFEAVEATSSSTAAAAGYFHGAGTAKLSVELNGFVKVSGSNKTAFVHKATAANTDAHITTLSYADPSQTDIVMVTPNYNPPGGPLAYNNHPIGVYWNGSAWTIFNQDFANIVNTSYNVMVIKQ